MASKQYDFKTLIQTYIETQRTHYLHEDFKNYYSSLLVKLEEIFQIKLSGADSGDAALWMLFYATARSYLKITHPWSFFLEDSLTNVRLMKRGEQGDKIFAISKRLIELNDESEQLHLQILYDLFEMMYGKVDTVFTSAELKTLGFDDSTEPKRWDSKYDDFY